MLIVVFGWLSLGLLTERLLLDHEECGVRDFFVLRAAVGAIRSKSGIYAIDVRRL